MARAGLTILLLVAFAAVNAYANDIGSVDVRGLGDRGSCPVRPWNAKQTAARERVIPIKFQIPYSSKPMVALGISGTDIDQRYNMRVNTEVQNLTNEGFDLKVGVWCNTYAYKLVITYFVVPDTYHPAEPAPAKELMNWG
ncbi:hypothetical protein BSKO_05701 [Bryopsis sp. KO-2023]|nr:hypothetical protein BSKO_05701 [Bryopsis sp. KO-2023]